MLRCDRAWRIDSNLSRLDLFADGFVVPASGDQQLGWNHHLRLLRHRDASLLFAERNLHNDSRSGLPHAGWNGAGAGNLLHHAGGLLRRWSLHHAGSTLLSGARRITTGFGDGLHDVGGLLLPRRRVHES